MVRYQEKTGKGETANRFRHSRKIDEPHNHIYTRNAPLGARLTAIARLIVSRRRSANMPRNESMRPAVGFVGPGVADALLAKTRSLVGARGKSENPRTFEQTNLCEPGDLEEDDDAVNAPTSTFAARSGAVLVSRDRRVSVDFAVDLSSVRSFLVASGREHRRSECGRASRRVAVGRAVWSFRLRRVLVSGIDRDRRLANLFASQRRRAGHLETSRDRQRRVSPGADRRRRARQSSLCDPRRSVHRGRLAR